MIVACGFVSSGTRLLYQIIRDDFGLPAIHRSYPHWEKFWDWRDYPVVTWVVITRRFDVVIESALAQGHPGIRKEVRREPSASREEIESWYQRWLEMSASMPGAYRISYEALVADPYTQTMDLARHLKANSRYRYRQIRDENAKWLDPARS